MHKRYALRFVLPLLALIVVATVAYAGGWAIITLNEFPDYVVAAKPLNLSFYVRQHGVTLLNDLKPTVRATNPAGRVAKVSAVAGRNRGEYTAGLVLPEPGDWTLTIASGFNNTEITLPVLKVVSSGSPAPTAFAPGTRGMRLFTAKGCVGCHRHLEVNPERQTDAKFDLTGRRFPPDYLRKFLADPSIKTPDMPNLKLSADEIQALAAFIDKSVLKQVEGRR